MNMKYVPTLVLLAGTAVFAQTTGISKPSAAEITTDSEPAPVAAPAPAPAATPDADTTGDRIAIIDGHQVTLKSPQVAVDSSSAFASSNDPDAGIVTSVPSRPDQLPEGTVIKVRMDKEVSTKISKEGESFSAHTTGDTLKDGKVVIPAGSQLEGRIIRLTSGRRINGSATIRLRPDDIILPDGSRYILHANVIDSDPKGNNKIDSEGGIVDKGHPKRDAVIVGGVAGASAVAGAEVAGVPGALVGAGVGAGVATTHFLMHQSNATLAKDSLLVIALSEPMQLTPLHAETQADEPLLHEGH